VSIRVQKLQALFLLQRLKESRLSVFRDFNNIKTRAVIKYFFPCKAERIHIILTKTIGENAQLYDTVKTAWRSVNVVIFPPALHLVLDDTKQ
jgi:hypothetical protein